MYLCMYLDVSMHVEYILQLIDTSVNNNREVQIISIKRLYIVKYYLNDRKQKRIQTIGRPIVFSFYW